MKQTLLILLIGLSPTTPNCKERFESIARRPARAILMQFDSATRVSKGRGSTSVRGKWTGQRMVFAKANQCSNQKVLSDKTFTSIFCIRQGQISSGCCTALHLKKIMLEKFTICYSYRNCSWSELFFSRKETTLCLDPPYFLGSSLSPPPPPTTMSKETGLQERASDL